MQRFQINERGEAVEVGDGSSYTQFNFGGVLAIICAALAGISVPIALWSGYRAAQAEREARMLEYYVNEVDGKLIHAGFIEPRERWSPEKRKQYEETKP